MEQMRQAVPGITSEALQFFHDVVGELAVLEAAETRSEALGHDVNNLITWILRPLSNRVRTATSLEEARLGLGSAVQSAKERAAYFAASLASLGSLCGNTILKEEVCALDGTVESVVRQVTVLGTNQSHLGELRESVQGLCEAAESCRRAAYRVARLSRRRIEDLLHFIGKGEHGMPHSEPRSIVLVDDEASFLKDYFEQALPDDSVYDAMAEGGTTLEAGLRWLYRTAQDERVDVVFVNVHLGGASEGRTGWDYLPEIIGNCPDACVIMVSNLKDREQASEESRSLSERAVARGAAGFIDKHLFSEAGGGDAFHLEFERIYRRYSEDRT
jgi:hypothetical protein